MAGLTVQLCGGPPWGFRLHGGRGQSIPLTVAKVRRKSKSFGHLLEGDEVSRIGGRSVEGLSHDEAMALVDSHHESLEMEIKRRHRESAAVSAESVSTTSEFASATKAPPNSIASEAGDEGSQKPLRTPVPSMETSPSQQLSTGLLTQQQQQQQQQQRYQQHYTSQNNQNSSQVFGLPQIGNCSSQESSTMRFDDRLHFTSQSSEKNEKNISSSSISRKNETTSSNNSATTVNISGAKFDFGSDFSASTNLTAGVRSVAPPSGFTSNPFAGVERILESESKTSKEQIPGGQLNRLETRETKITSDGAYVQSHTLSEHKTSSTSTTSPLSVSVHKAKGGPDDDILLVSPTGRPIKERYYKPLPDEQLKEIDDIMAPILSKKKVFTSSSFYEDANQTYPTVEEQVGMARKIAESLSSDSNAQSKGANMFFRRVKRSHKWVHQAPGVSESEYTESEDCSTIPGPDQFPGVKISKEPPKLKLLMAPTAPKWEPSGEQDITVSPEVCLDIVKGLNSPSGKGSQMFAKRKKKSEDWVVDVDKLKAQLGDKWPEKSETEEAPPSPVPPPPPPPPKPSVQAPRIKENTTPAERYLEQINNQASVSRLRLVKSPWEAAMESPIGAVDSAFQTVTEPVAGDCSLPVSWNNQLVRTPPAASSAPPEVSSIPLDPLTASAPRGWARPPSGDTKNVCVTVNKKKPPPPPPRPDKIRPFMPAPPAVGPSPASGVSRGVPHVSAGNTMLEIEAGPPVQFFSSINDFYKPSASSSSYPQYSPGGNATAAVVSNVDSSSSRLFSPYDCQNFNAAPRGFGFSASKGPPSLRSVRL